MRRSLSAVMISSVARTFSRRSAVALEIRPVGEERAAPLAPWRRRALPARAPGFRGTLRAWRGAVTPPIVTVDRDRPGRGLHDVVAHAGEQPVGGDQHVVRRAVVQDDAELVAGKAAEMVLAAHAGARMRLATAAITSSATSKP